MGVLHQHCNAVWQLQKWQFWPRPVRAYKDHHSASQGLPPLPSADPRHRLQQAR